MDYPKPITNIDDLPKRYGGSERERFWQENWEKSGVYKFSLTRPDGSVRERKDLFTIDTPPPTVSGALHIGHVYSYTQTDFTARYQRMTGKHVFYPFGFDDNGLPSERLVESFTGKRAHEVGREEFIELCKPILEDAEKQFTDLWRSLALSCDWEQFYTTIDARSRAISQASFIDLYNKGYIYRKEAPTQWCWADQTAIAQAEIEDKEVSGHFHDITFQIDDGTGKLTPVTIATTRPELIPACVAVFAHPDDQRYKHLFGKKAITPLFEVEVPILPSEKADPEKGTGILMCCTFGDQDDVEHWNMEWPEDIVPGRKLPTRVIVGKDGRIVSFDTLIKSTEHSAMVSDPDEIATQIQKAIDRNPLDFSWPSRNPDKASRIAVEMAGLKIKAARNWIKEQLTEAGLITNVEEITHTVRHSERGGVPIEVLVTPQWYINLLDHKEELIAQGRKVTWHPEYMFKRYEHWVEGLNQDWCISRQRYNGVPFPVWYDGEGNAVLADAKQLPVNPLVDKPTGLGRADRRVRHDQVPSGKAESPTADTSGLLIYRRRLPHWRLPGSVYFLTWRLHKDQPRLSPQARSIVLEALRWFSGERYKLFAWVVMDDHVHALVQVLDDMPLEEQVRRWKSLTANRLQRECGYEGNVWQEEYFDRIIRDEDEYWDKAQYILSNAMKRWPEEVDYSWAGWSAEGGKEVDCGTGGGVADTAVRPTDIIPEPDVMDTWATSSVTPLLNTHLRIERDEKGEVITTPRHDGIFPYDMRPQAHDIIRTWAFYTIAKSFYHFGEIPWQDIVISGHAQDAKRKKISKSKGHVVTPAEMVSKYSADNLRYWAAGCKLGTDTIYDEKSLTDGKRLINKLFNATKFALRHLLDFDPSNIRVEAGPRPAGDNTGVGDPGYTVGDGGRGRAPYRPVLDEPQEGWVQSPTPTNQTNGGQGRPPHQDTTAHYNTDALLSLVTYPTDKWILERLRLTIERATKANAAFEFSDALTAAEEFFWGDLCDNYLELSKGRLYSDERALAAHPNDDGDALRRSAQVTLFLTLGACLKLFAPVLPHITEECWSWYHARWTSGRSIHEETWPPHDKQVGDDASMQAGRLLTDILALVRKWKSERSISIKKPVARLNIHLLAGWEKRFESARLSDVMGDLLSTTNSALTSVGEGDMPEDAAIIEGVPFAVSMELAEEAD